MTDRHAKTTKAVLLRLSLVLQDIVEVEATLSLDLLDKSTVVGLLKAIH